MREQPLLEVRGLNVYFPLAHRRPLQPKRVLKAVDGIDLDIAPGKTLGLVGESGSGKTTTALAVMQLLAVTGGSIRLDGKELVGLAGGALRAARRDVQMIFQDPYSSLNPRLRAGAIVEEPLRLSAMGDDRERDERVRELFAQVGLSDGQRALFPHQFSGGQRQRIGIARALALQPKLVVCDEPVSALDVAVQAQVLNLLVRLQEKFGLTYLFISHDLAVVEYMCDDVAVMYLGQIVEYASRERLFERPLHPYTWALFSAIPRIEVGDRSKTNRVRLQGDPPSPVDLPAGCRFAGRCPFAEQVCRDNPAPLREIEAGHRVACHLVGADGSTPHVSAQAFAPAHP